MTAARLLGRMRWDDPAHPPCPLVLLQQTAHPSGIRPRPKTTTAYGLLGSPDLLQRRPEVRFSSKRLQSDLSTLGGIGCFSEHTAVTLHQRCSIGGHEL